MQCSLPHAIPSAHSHCFQDKQSSYPTSNYTVPSWRQQICPGHAFTAHLGPLFPECANQAKPGPGGGEATLQVLTRTIPAQGRGKDLPESSTGTSGQRGQLLGLGVWRGGDVSPRTKWQTKHPVPTTGSIWPLKLP